MYKDKYLCTKLIKKGEIDWFLCLFFMTPLQKARHFDDKFVLEYCPRVYIEGGYY